MKKQAPIAKGDLPILHHYAEFKKDIFSFLQNNGASLGSIYTFNLFKRKYYVLNHPDFVKHVMVDNVKNYSRKKSYAILQEMLGHGLITTEGEEWRKRRRIAQPAFYKEKLELLLQQMETSVENYILDWDKKANQKMDLDSEMSQITLSVLSNSIIQSDLEKKFPSVKKNLAQAWEYLAQKRFNTIKLLNFLPNKTKTDGKKAIADLKATILEIIEKRRNSEAPYADLLSMLMASTDEETTQKLKNEELLDEVMTLFTAGHDTTAMVLIWAFYLIGHHPEVEENIVAEIKERYTGQAFSMKDLMGFQYTKMVIQEVMRLYPPVWTFGRRAIEADQIGEYQIPADARITIPALIIHRNPEFWEKPNEFYPEHFLPEKIKTQKKFSYFPFGGGQHLCIGEHYAMMEMQLVLIHVLRKYKIKLESNKPVGMNLLITIRPKEIIWTRFEKRN